MSEQNLVSKISVAKCHGKLDKNNLPKEPILRVGGIASGTKTGTSNYGPWTALTGDFVAINTQTGEEYRSGVCFVPGTALSLIEGALAQSPDGVEFGFDFGVKKADNAVGYEYTVKPVIKAKESEAMSNLLTKMAQAAPLAIGQDKGGKKK